MRQQAQADAEEFFDDDLVAEEDDEDELCSCGRAGLLCSLFTFLCCSEPGDLTESPYAVATVLCATLVTFGLLLFIATLAARNRPKVIYNEVTPLGPVQRTHASPPKWIDVIYTYVNGSHPEVERQLQRAKDTDMLPYRPHDARYRDDGLFQFALRSLLAAQLVQNVRNVYIITSGEIPTFLPMHELRPVGRRDDRSGDDRTDDAANRTRRLPSCHAQSGFTQTTLGMPLEQLITSSGGSTHHHESSPGRRRRMLYIVPHAVLFPDPPTELPTFNSNAILCVAHRIPRLGRWFLYSDDDTVITQSNLTLAAWWDTRRGATKTYFSGGHGISRKRRPLANNWEEAMSHMSGLLDTVVPLPPPPPPSLAPPPAASFTSRIFARFHTPTPPTPTPPPPPPPLPVPHTWPPVAACPRWEPGAPGELSNLTAQQLAERVVASLIATNRSHATGSGGGGSRRGGNAARGRGRSATAGPRRSAAQPTEYGLFDRRFVKSSVMRYYARPQHMPVLLSRDLVAEIEARWPTEFERTRRHRLRLGHEIELNFLYHHYLRATQFATEPTPSSRTEFLFAQRCAKHEGAARCKRLLDQSESDFITFNDDATRAETLHAGLTNLHRLLRDKYGTF